MRSCTRSRGEPRSGMKPVREESHQGEAGGEAAEV